MINHIINVIIYNNMCIIRDLSLERVMYSFLPNIITNVFLNSKCIARNTFVIQTNSRLDRYLVQAGGSSKIKLKLYAKSCIFVVFA